MKERILYHICNANISYGNTYIISRKRYIIENGIVYRRRGFTVFKWISAIFKTPVDETERSLIDLFGYLINDYGFHYFKGNLGDLLDARGKVFFSGPLYLYQFYNENVCLNILYLAQRDEHYGYITEKHTTDQMYIRNGTEVLERFGYQLPLLAQEIKDRLLRGDELFGC